MVNIPKSEYRPTILLVEERQESANLTLRLLSRTGYGVDYAPDSEQAALIVRNKLPDLIIVEAVLPGKSGFDFCRELKSNPLTELIPVIVFTELSDSKDRIEAIEAGADYFLSRPALPGELIVRIKSLLRHGEAIQRRVLLSQANHRDSEFDAFISHASEDKDEFVRPLAQRLNKSGIRIWYDEHELQVGDSLREAIERGLAHSNYGIVVLSPHFFAKRWPQRELSGLTAREHDGRKVILPVWFNLTFEDVVKSAPMLADRIAARSQDGMDAVVQRLMKVIRPDLPSQNKPPSAKSDKTNKRKAKERGPHGTSHTDQLLRELYLLLLQPADSSPDGPWELVDWQTMRPASKSRVRKYVQGWIADPGFPSYEVIERIAADAGCPVKLASQDPMCVEFAE